MEIIRFGIYRGNGKSNFKDDQFGLTYPYSDFKTKCIVILDYRQSLYIVAI
jgi:hypothetical protein